MKMGAEQSLRMSDNLRDRATSQRSILEIYFDIPETGCPSCCKCSEAYHKQIFDIPAEIRAFHSQLLNDAEAFLKARYQLDQTPMKIRWILYEKDEVTFHNWTE